MVEPGRDADPIVQWTRRLAESFHSPWIVLYVETPRPLLDEGQSQATKTLAFAREAGAEVITTAGDDVVAAVLRVAAQRGVTQIIVGKPIKRRGRNFLSRGSFLKRLLRDSGSVGVQVVPAADVSGGSLPSRVGKTKNPVWPQYVKALGAIAVVAMASFLFAPLVGAHATALIFLLTVVLLALFVDRGPTLVAAAMSALLWDYFFLTPIYALRITSFEDAMLFGMYFVVALVLGHLTTRIRAQEEAERQRETRATALYLLARDLSEAVDLDQMAQRIVHHLQSCFKAEVALLLPDSTNVLRLNKGSTLTVPEGEQSIPQWVIQHRQRAGKFTNDSLFATALYIPLATSGGLVGVLGLRFAQPFGPTIHQENLLETFSQQIAMAIERYRLNGISEKAKLLAESERLSKTLLDSMSHEIRTPIAAIQSATGNLAQLQDCDSRVRQEMIAEIQEATERLNRLVGNVLEASRLESGAVKPRLNECDVSELIHVVLADTEKDLKTHKITVAIEPRLPVVPMDFVLMQQALTNLLSNSALHTPAGTPIEIAARLEHANLLISVADRGPGIPPDCLPRIFDKFYRVPNSRTGGTGLGLSLVKGFIEAHGGRVKVENRSGGGVTFTICLPLPNPVTAPAEANP